MAARDVEYEKYVRRITEALLRAQGLDTVKVQHDVRVHGLSRSHQVDVYWEYKIAGLLHRVVINCKHYRSTVEVTDVLTLGGVLNDMPGVRGIIISTIGFQKGAVDYAKTHQIGLKIVRPPQDDDWDGRLREVHTELRLHVPELTSCQVGFNRAWVEANMACDPETLVGTATLDARTTRVRDSKADTVSDINALWNRAMNENPTEGAEGRGVIQWEDGWFERPGQPAIRIDAMGFRWKLHMDVMSQTIKMRHDPEAIVRDAVDGTLLFVDADGTVTGDLEEERQS